MKSETSTSIGQWADETFGLCHSYTDALNRVRKEFEELETSIFNNEPDAAIAAEAADVIITLTRIFNMAKVDMGLEIDAKMAINRNRKWKRDKDGTGKHIRC